MTTQLKKKHLQKRRLLEFSLILNSSLKYLLCKNLKSLRQAFSYADGLSTAFFVGLYICGRSLPDQIVFEIMRIFLAALRSLFQMTLHFEHCRTPTPFVFGAADMSFSPQLLHTLDVLSSSIGRTIRGFVSFALFYRVLHSSPTTPGRIPFSLVWSFLNMAAPNTISGTRS
jgi:hypothetical protein